MKSYFVQLQSHRMSKKRKNNQDSDNENFKDAVDEKKCCLGEDVNENKNKHFFDFDVFSACENLPSDTAGCVSVKDINPSMFIADDFSVYDNDSLFINSDSSNYEYILTDNDLFNSVSNSTNFYDETITLYNNNCENEISFDNSFEKVSSAIVEPAVTSVAEMFQKNDTHANTTNADIFSVTDNLENIVPNVCVNSYVSSDNNFSNFTGSNEISSAEIVYEQNPRTEGSLISNTDLNLCLNEDLTNSCKPEENIRSVSDESFYLKESESYTNFLINNKCINNDKNVNNIIKIFGPSNSYQNLKIIPLKLVKRNDVLTNEIVSQIENKGTILQKVINVKNLRPSKVNFNYPQLSNNDLRNIMTFLKQKNVPLVKHKVLFKNQNVKKPIQSLEKSKISKVGVSNIGKCIETVQKCNNYSSITETEELQKKKKSDASDSKDILTLERIKKPEPFNNLFLFTFAVNIRSSLSTVFTQEDFVNNNEKLSYYTGIPQYSYFMALLNILNLPNNNTISPFQMLLLTLMKIRLNLDWTDLAYRFGRSVQVAKDAFGITMFILIRCLSTLVKWPVDEVCIDHNLCRAGKNFYVYSIKVNSERSNNREFGERIFICLSNSGHPIHFVSKPVSEEYKSRLDILEFSGIIKGLVQNDNIIFDKNTNYSSNFEEWNTVLSVMSKSRDSLYMQSFTENIVRDLEKMKKVVDEIKKYKFLCDGVSCEWVNATSDDSSLFTDAVHVVCGLINLCDILPFSNSFVKNIISERKNIKIMLT